MDDPDDSHWSDEETDNPLYADERTFYKVEKWTKDGMQVDRLLYAGNNLTKARDIFTGARGPSFAEPQKGLAGPQTV
jgi:hypothetical protein